MRSTPRLIGMVHLHRLTGRGADLAEVEAAAVQDARVLIDAGYDGLMVENFGDKPFYPDAVPPHTVAAMTRIALAVAEVAAPAGVPLGINVLRNDVMSALAVAHAVGAQFVRVNVHIGAAVTDQGLIQGRAHESVRYRDELAPGVAIWADVRVKHAVPLGLRPIAEEALELAERGAADALVVSGTRTGGATDPERLRLVREAVGDHPILIGSGVTPERLPALAEHATGFIVGTWIKAGGATTSPVDPARARALAAAARDLA